MDFKRAIVREISDTYSRCIRDDSKTPIDLSRTRKQHKDYQNTLIELGLDLIVLPQENEFPDACFVEDNVVLYGNNAMISRMGAPSRRGEEIAILEVLKEYKNICHTTSPATIEGGDVIHLQNRLICGLGTRTNEEGVSQARRYLDVTIDTIAGDFVHLKSHVTYLGSDIMISTAKFAEHPLLSDFDIIKVPPDEAYAANTLTVGDTVILPMGFPGLNGMIRERGFETIQLQTDQFQLCDGALTCLSIIF